MAMKNGLKTVSFDASLVRPIPFLGSIAKPVIIHEVMVSGTFFLSLMLEVLQNNVKVKTETQLESLKTHLSSKLMVSYNQVSGKSFLMSTADSLPGGPAGAPGLPAFPSLAGGIGMGKSLPPDPESWFGL